MSMRSYSGRAYYRMIFANVIWGTYIFGREGGGAGIMEFYGILLSGVMLCLADSLLNLRYQINA